MKKVKDPFWPQHGVPLPCFLFFSGLLVLSILNAWVVLFAPLNFQLLLIESLLLILLLPFYNPIKIIKAHRNPIIKKFSVLELIFFGSVLLTLVYLSALVAVNNDTAIYHLQIIRWVHEQGTVPGLANLFPRLGLGSSLFNLISLFYIPQFKTENFNFLNVTVCIWAFTWLFSKWHFFYHKRQTDFRHNVLSIYYLLIICYMIADWQLLRDSSNSTSYDFIVSFLGIICLSFLIEDIFNSKFHPGSKFLIAILLAIPSFKLSGGLLALLVIHQLISGNRLKMLVPAIVFSFLFITPVLIKNHVTTGYVLYPIPFTIDHPEWQLPKAMVIQFQNYITNANRFYNSQQFFIEHFEKTNLNWTPYWWQGILIQHKILLILALGSTLVLLFFRKMVCRKKTILLLSFILIMILGWFYAAPDPRFAYGFILPLCLIGPALLLGSLNSGNLQTSILVLFLAGIFIYSFSKMKSDPQLVKSLLTASSIQKPEIKTSSLNKTVIYSPQVNKEESITKCYFLPIPCIYQDNPFLQLRGNNLKNGFKMNKDIDSIYIKNYQY